MHVFDSIVFGRRNETFVILDNWFNEIYGITFRIAQLFEKFCRKLKQMDIGHD